MAVVTGGAVEDGVHVSVSGDAAIGATTAKRATREVRRTNEVFGVISLQWVKSWALSNDCTASLLYIL